MKCQRYVKRGFNMKVLMREKKFGVTSPIREVIIQGNFRDYYGNLDEINEKLLIQNLPAYFLLHLQPKDLSIMVEDEIIESVGRVLSDTGQRNLKLFKDYDKYDKRYSLLLCR